MNSPIEGTTDCFKTAILVSSLLEKRGVDAADQLKVAHCMIEVLKSAYAGAGDLTDFNQLEQRIKEEAAKEARFLLEGGS